MKWILVRVRPRKLRLTARVGAKHVVVDEEVVIAESFGCLRVVLGGLNVVAELDLRKDDPVFHGVSPFWRVATTAEAAKAAPCPVILAKSALAVNLTSRRSGGFRGRGGLSPERPAGRQHGQRRQDRKRNENRLVAAPGQVGQADAQRCHRAS